MECNLLTRFASVPAAAQCASLGYRIYATQPLAYGFLAEGDSCTSTKSGGSQSSVRKLLPVEARRVFGILTDSLRSSADQSIVNRRLQNIAYAFLRLCKPLVGIVIGPRTADQAEDSILCLTAPVPNDLSCWIDLRLKECLQTPRARCGS